MKLIKDIGSLKYHDNTKVIICPPACYLPFIKHSKCYRGAQNCFIGDQGAFTGEISPQQLKELGCDYVIIGHYERRSLFHETYDMIHQKAVSIVQHGLIPIICIGETYEERLEGRFHTVLRSQIDRLTYNLDQHRYIIAYEPVWAIGTGLSPNTEDIQVILNMLRSYLDGRVPIIYGGSVTPKNIISLSKLIGLNGVLVGGASLDMSGFQAIIDGF